MNSNVEGLCSNCIFYKITGNFFYHPSYCIIENQIPIYFFLYSKFETTLTIGFDASSFCPVTQKTSDKINVETLNCQMSVVLASVAKTISEVHNRIWVERRLSTQKFSSHITHSKLIIIIIFVY